MHSPGSRTLALIGIWERAGGWPIDDETHTLVESYGDGWAWSVPLSADRRCFTAMVDPAVTSVGGASLSKAYLAELHGTRHMSALLEGAVAVGPPFARDASAYSSDRAALAGRLLVGDAASFVDPLSSFGVKKAMASAWLAAVVVHTCLDSDRMIEPSLTLYESREQSMFASLMEGSASLARDAAPGQASDFWSKRVHTGPREADADIDVSELRKDPDVLAAFADIRGRETLSLRAADGVSRSSRPVVRGNRIVLEPHLVSAAFADGIRYIRNVDVLALSDIAVGGADAGAMFAAYNRSNPVVGLPDFLGALSVLVGKGLLVNS